MWRNPPRISAGATWLAFLWLMYRQPHRFRATRPGDIRRIAGTRRDSDGNSQGKNFVAVTGQEGTYSFPDLTDGTWTIEVEMSGFSTIKQNVTIAPNASSPIWELRMLPLDEMNAQNAPAAAPHRS